MVRSFPGPALALPVLPVLVATVLRRLALVVAPQVRGLVLRLLVRWRSRLRCLVVLQRVVVRSLVLRELVLRRRRAVLGGSLVAHRCEVLSPAVCRPVVGGRRHVCSEDSSRKRS